MKRLGHGLLAALLIVGSTAAKTYTDKTFLMPRSHQMNMAMEYTSWHKPIAIIDHDKFGGSVQATAFYQESNNEEELGKYFGARNWMNGSCCVNDFFAVIPSDETNAPRPWHLSGKSLFHLGTADQNIAPTALTLADKLVWRPYSNSYGIRLDYNQKLDKVLKGLFFRVSAPIVHVKTSMGWTSTCECGSPCGVTCDCDSCDSCDTCRSCGCEDTCACEESCDCDLGYCVKQKLAISHLAPLSGAEKSVADYLTGHVSNTFTGAAQVALCKGKIHNHNCETGVADIDVLLGYNFLYKPTKQVSINIAATIPTGNTPDAEFLFPAIVGNAGHWAVGAGMDARFQVWKSKKYKRSLDALFAFNYRYLFSNTEERIIGFNWPYSTILAADGNAEKRDIYGHWELGAKKGDTHATPMANFLARDVKVTPGSHFEAIAQLAFNWSHWTFDLGYNLFAKEEENVRLKKACNDSCGCEDACGCDECCGSCADNCGGWQDDTIGIPLFAWDTNTPFAQEYLYGYSEGQAPWINCEDLCTSVAMNPSVVTHKIYCGMNYSFDKWQYPLLLGLGASYEWATDNDCLETWALWAKVGLTF